jgi:lipopolysaccharide/colanic/teichoic acid biosynthesis glycosyltransferase
MRDTLTTARTPIWKALLDFSLSALGLLAISPLLLGIALAIKVSSPGPVFYRRRVMGRGGSQFDAFKFRTMVMDGDAILAARPDLMDALARDQKLRDDPRITGCGRWLRKFSLDELPQLFNVLRGEMSLVGPRMISPPELARYGLDAGELLTVNPGMTGLWQVAGRSGLAGSDRVRLDLEYVRTRSPWLDLKLLMLTIPAVLTGRGAF